MLADAGTADAVGPAAAAAVAPAAPAAVVAPNSPPVVVPDAAGAPPDAGGCDEVVPSPLNRLEVGPAEGVDVAAVPACGVDAFAAPPRLEKRFDVVPVLAGVAEAPEVFCWALKRLGVWPLGALLVAVA